MDEIYGDYYKIPVEKIIVIESDEKKSRDVSDSDEESVELNANADRSDITEGDIVEGILRSEASRLNKDNDMAGVLFVSLMEINQDPMTYMKKL